MTSIPPDLFSADEVDIVWFGHSLMQWHRHHKRPLPWKGESDPYKIWISEVVLQQTRVEQGLPYYLKLIDRYPDVQSLADSTEDELFRIWEGLGYYRRAKLLHRAARVIVDEHGGKFPDTYHEILSLPGIGEYTASAIASLAFGMPYAVVDGNVKRILSRFFGMHLSTERNPGKQILKSLAQAALAHHPSWQYNQAIMDAGATVCKPRQPHCEGCCFKERCFAYAHSSWDSLPNVNKKISRKKRIFHYLVLHDKQGYLMNKRPEGDIWAGMYDFKLFELTGSDTLSEAQKMMAQYLNDNYPETGKFCEVVGPYEQALTHRDIASYFHIWTHDKLDNKLAPEIALYVPFQGRHEISMPRTVRKFVENSTYLLDLYKSSQHTNKNNDQ